jgi:hypothetical protein
MVKLHHAMIINPALLALQAASVFVQLLSIIDPNFIFSFAVALHA